MAPDRIPLRASAYRRTREVEQQFQQLSRLSPHDAAAIAVWIRRTLADRVRQRFGVSRRLGRASRAPASRG